MLINIEILYNNQILKFIMFNPITGKTSVIASIHANNILILLNMTKKNFSSLDSLKTYVKENTRN